MFALYALGLVLAPLVAFVLKRTLLRGRAPVFVLEMPGYRWPSLGGVVRRMVDAAWMFLRRAGTIILASMVLVWVLLNFPAGDYPRRIAEVERKAEDEPEQAELYKKEKNDLHAQWKRDSFLGQAGRWIEPAVRPLGWDWRIGVAALASFPAREVVVSTLGILFHEGKVDSDEIRDADNILETDLGKALKEAKHADGRPLFTVPAALSLMVFFALCCQCASTLAVIRRETGSWGWPVLTFVYMTVLAYLAALLVYQVGSLLG
jgi:ferrous iron transport protein B